MKKVNIFYLVLTVLFLFVVISPSNIIATGSNVTFRNDGITLFNNQPFFPVGLFYWFPDDNPSIPSDHTGKMEVLKNAGFNTVFLGGNRPDLSYLDQAQNLGLKVVNYNAFFNSLDNSYYLAISNHPSLLAWYGVDEPEVSNFCIYNNSTCSFNDQSFPFSQWYNRLWLINNLIHPIWSIYSPGVETNFIKAWNNLTKTAITGIDIYTSPPGQWNRPPTCLDVSIRCVGEMVDKIISVTGIKKPIWMGLQGFTNIPPEGLVNNVSPNLTQTRFMAYQAIVHGATGVFWWNYGLKTTDVTAPNDMWRSLKLVATELTDTNIMPALLGINRITTQSGPVKILSTDDVLGKYKYKIAVNETTRLAGNYIISGFSPNSDIFVLVENRWLKTDDLGNINDRFDDWDVHLYRQEIQTSSSLPGDLDSNGKVDIYDFALVVQNFNKSETDCSPNWNIADIVPNCRVDIFDFALVVQNFGK